MNNMKISYIEIKRIKTQGTLLAFASICLSGQINIKLASIAIHQLDSSYWITFPRIKTPQGESFYSYIPLDNETHKLIEKAVVEKYMKEVKENDRGIL